MINTITESQTEFRFNCSFTVAAMNSKIIGLLLVFSVLLAAVNAVDFEFTQEDLDDFMNIVDGGSRTEGRNIVKRGSGKRIIRE